MSNCFVSIIVPVYNVESILKRCLESLINQTYQELEIIVVNDGSTDRSDAICDFYAEIDSRVKVLHKKNGGLSDARNLGIANSNGEYLAFVDSDDYLELDTIERLITYAKNESLDVVCGDTTQIIERIQGSFEKKILKGGINEGEILTGEDFLVESIRLRQFSPAVWTRIYKANLIKNNDIYFKKDLLHEDEQWTPRVLLSAKKVGYIKYAFYNYVIRENSITQAKDKRKHIKDIFVICNELHQFYNENVRNQNNKLILNDYLARLYINTSINGGYDDLFYKGIIQKSFPLKNAWYLKTKIEVVIYYLNFKLYRYIKKNIKK